MKKILATSRTLMHLQGTRLMLALLVLAALVLLLGTHPAAAQEAAAAAPQRLRTTRATSHGCS